MFYDTNWVPRQKVVFINCLADMGIYNIMNLYGNCVRCTYNLASFIADIAKGNVSNLSTSICISVNNSNSYIIKFN
jgi:hypothetical protein